MGRLTPELIGDQLASLVHTTGKLSFWAIKQTKLSSAWDAGDDPERGRGPYGRPRARHGGDGGDQDGAAADHRVSAVAAAAVSAGELEGKVVGLSSQAFVGRTALIGFGRNAPNDLGMVGLRSDIEELT